MNAKARAAVRRTSTGAKAKTDARVRAAATCTVPTDAVSHADPDGTQSRHGLSVPRRVTYRASPGDLADRRRWLSLLRATGRPNLRTGALRRRLPPSRRLRDRRAYLRASRP